MSPEQKKAVQDAMTRLAQVPNYCGAVLILVTNDFRDVQLSKHGVRDELIDQALLGLVRQRAIAGDARPSIIVPSNHNNRAQRRQHGGG